VAALYFADGAVGVGQQKNMILNPRENKIICTACQELAMPTTMLEDESRQRPRSKIKTPLSRPFGTFRSASAKAPAKPPIQDPAIGWHACSPTPARFVRRNPGA